MGRQTLKRVSRLAGVLMAIGMAVPVFADGGSTVATGPVVVATETSQVDGQRAAVTAVIQRWIAAVNREDRAAVTHPWVGDNTIIDSFPPFVWQGPKAIGTWWSDYQSLKTSQGLADVVFSFESRHIDVVSERAYVVGDAVVDYTLTSGRLRDRATWTFCLERRDGAWLLTAWAWGHLDRGAVPKSP